MASGGFIARWAWRKALAQRGALSDEPPAGAAPPAPNVDSASAEPDEAILARLKLPALDSLDYASDYTVFLGPEVPEHIRRQALRKLWLSHPVLANRDGLYDYQDDYTDAATVPEVLKTAYRVGRGFLKESGREPPAGGDITNETVVAAASAQPGEVVGENMDGSAPQPSSQAANSQDSTGEPRNSTDKAENS